MRLRVAIAVLVDRQFLPVTTQIQHLQNVVEDLVEPQIRCRTAATDREMRQDKLLKLSRLQLRRDRLPALRFHHSGPSKKRALPYSVVTAEISGPERLTAKFDRLQKPVTS